MGVWSGKWCNYRGTEVTVSIYGMSANKTLVMAKEPMAVSWNADSDIFTPMRSCSGYVRVLAVPGDIDELWGDNVMDHRVELTAGGNTLWMGYVKQEGYSQALNMRLAEMEIPVIDMLEAMKGERPNFGGSLMTLGGILQAGFRDMGLTVNYVYFPAGITLSTVLKRTIQTGVWSSEATWWTVMEDICKAWGWSMMMVKDAVYFCSVDVNSGNMQRVTYSALYTGSSVTSVSADTLSGVTVAGADHSMSINQGKNLVKVTGEVGGLMGGYEDGMLWEMKEDDMSSSGMSYMTGSDGRNTQKYCVFNLGGSQGKMTCYSSVSGPVAKKKLENFLEDSSTLNSGTPYGCWIEAIGYDALKNRTAAVDMHEAYEWATGVYMCPRASGLSSYVGIKIVTDEIETLDGNWVLCVNGTVETLAESWANMWGTTAERNKDLSLKVKIKFGNYYFSIPDRTTSNGIWSTTEQTQNMYCMDGQLVSFSTAMTGSRKDYKDVVQGAKVELPGGVKGRVEFSIYVPDTAASVILYLIKNLSVKVFRDTFAYAKASSSNNAERKIGQGNDNSYTVSNVLTCARENQMGLGCVLDAGSTDSRGNTVHEAVTSLDGSGVYPENVLLSRLITHFTGSQRVLKVNTREDTVSPLTRWTYKGRTYAAVGWDMDYRDQRAMITFAEVKSAGSSSGGSDSGDTGGGSGDSGGTSGGDTGGGSGSDTGGGTSGGGSSTQVIDFTIKNGSAYTDNIYSNPDEWGYASLVLGDAVCLGLTSPDINNSETTTVEIYVGWSGNTKITFGQDCESGSTVTNDYDHMRILGADGAELYRSAGVKGNTIETEVTVPTNCRLKFMYKKDASQSDGLDCVWIKKIEKV